MFFLGQSCPRATFRGRAGVGGRTFMAIVCDRRLVGAWFNRFPDARDAAACESAAISFSKIAFGGSTWCGFTSFGLFWVAVHFFFFRLRRPSRPAAAAPASPYASLLPCL